MEAWTNYELATKLDIKPANIRLATFLSILEKIGINNILDGKSVFFFL